MIRWLIPVLAIGFVAGCSSAPVARGPGPPTGFSGQGTNIVLEEVIGSMPVEGAHQVYQNLHVGLATIVTPRKASNYDPAQAASLVCRLEPRVAAQVLKVLTDSPTISPHRLDHLRDALASTAQAAADEALAKCPEAATYNLEVVVVSLYWTDSTVGRTYRGASAK